MPQECMRDNVSRTDGALITLSPVIGQIPPLARVAAITAPESAVISTEHNWNDFVDFMREVYEVPFR